MKITETSRAGTPVLVLAGRLDSSTDQAAQTRLLAAAGDGRRSLVLDLAGVDYVSSAGLRVLVLLAKRAESLRIPIALCAIRPNLRELLEISDLLDLFATDADAPVPRA